LRVNQFKPMRGGSSYIDAPDAIKNEKANVNVRHLDNKCFMWALLSAIDIRDVPDDCDRGYFLEVDLVTPEELHDAHADFPLAPERRNPPASKVPKLFNMLYDKVRYVLHFRVLKLYLSLGLRLAKIHRVLQFKQSLRMESYIKLNTERRMASRNPFEKEFYKHNSVFGKTMENIRNHVDIRLVTKEKQAKNPSPNTISRVAPYLARSWLLCTCTKHPSCTISRSREGKY